MKVLKIAAIVLGGLIGTYYLAFGILYFAGYRVYRIPTVGMQPTIRQNEKVVGRLSENFRSHVKRFDLAIFRTPQAPGEIYVKRVVGLSGERISIDAKGVKINGQPLPLPSTVSVAGLGLIKCDLAVPMNAVFLLGDYTASSLDSRYLGSIPKADLLGYLVFKQ